MRRKIWLRDSLLTKLQVLKESNIESELLRRWQVHIRHRLIVLRKLKGSSARIATTSKLLFNSNLYLKWKRLLRNRRWMPRSWCSINLNSCIKTLELLWKDTKLVESTRTTSSSVNTGLNSEISFNLPTPWKLKSKTSTQTTKIQSLRIPGYSFSRPWKISSRRDSSLPPIWKSFINQNPLNRKLTKGINARSNGLLKVSQGKSRMIRFKLRGVLSDNKLNKQLMQVKRIQFIQVPPNTRELVKDPNLDQLTRSNSSTLVRKLKSSNKNHNLIKSLMEDNLSMAKKSNK